MEIREAYRDEIEKLAAVREMVGPDFPSSESLLTLRESPRVLMPVAVAGTEIVGFAVAEVITRGRGRVGTVRYLESLVGEGSVDRAIKGALLSRLGQKLKDLEADEIEIGADQPREFVGHLEKAGYRLDAQESERSPAFASRRRFVKSLKPASSPWARTAAPGRVEKGMVE